jgi:hypothetical protein
VPKEIKKMGEKDEITAVQGTFTGRTSTLVLFDKLT